MTRREVAENVFQYMRDNKFQPINIQYLDGYFVFDMGEDGVVHFDIKGLHGWRFGMWLETDLERLKMEGEKEYPVIQFFGQHELNIDKFRPSRSFFSEEYYLDDIEGDYPRLYYRVIDILQMIKKHPFISFAMDYYEDKCFDESSYICFYLHERFYHARKKVIKFIKDSCTFLWHRPKVWFINRYKVVEKAEFIDHNDDGGSWYPRFSMEIHFRKISDDEEEQNYSELKMITFWLKKYYYKNMNVYLYREGIEGTYYYG